MLMTHKHFEIELSSTRKLNQAKSVSLGLFAVILFYLTANYFNYIFILVVGTVLFLAAVKRPSIIIITLILFFLLPTIMETVNNPWEEIIVVHGLSWTNFLIIIMLCSCCYFVYIEPSIIATNSSLFKITMFFALFFLFQIVRNVKTYGLSAPGEFRSHYLLMVVLLYVAFSNRDQLAAIKNYKLIINISLALPICLFPIIGMLKGWDFGSDSRFFYASVSLGILYGIVALLFGCKYQLFKMNYIYITALTIMALFLIVIDGHRSVWITCIAMIILLFYLREIRFFDLLKYFIPIIIFLIIVSAIVNSTGLEILSYMYRRGNEIFFPGTEGTGFWRLSLWRVQLDKFIASPLIGEGFGGYWLAFIPGLKSTIDVAPHSLYVQILAKLGLIGLFLYLGTVIMCAKRLYLLYEFARAYNHPITGIVLTSLVVLISSHAYYAVYAFEPYSFLFSGVGLSLVLRNNRIVETINSDYNQ